MKEEGLKNKCHRCQSQIDSSLGPYIQIGLLDVGENLHKSWIRFHSECFVAIAGVEHFTILQDNLKKNTNLGI